MLNDKLVLVRGGGELGSASARLLFRCGFPVVVLETERPLSVRRLVCYAEAIFSDEATVEGVAGRRISPVDVPSVVAPRAFIPVVVDPEAALLPALRPAVVVDARMAKRNLGTWRNQAGVVIGLGPGFTAGEDVHAVVETQRGPEMGRVYWAGSPASDTGRPDPVLGIVEARVLRSPRDGVFRGAWKIGESVLPGSKVGAVDGEPVTAQIGGLVRGLLADGVAVARGTKVGDIDPRGRAVDPARISDKGRAVAAGVLEATLVCLEGRA